MKLKFKSLNLKDLEYVCCTYSENLWIGLITDIDMEEKDAKNKVYTPILAKCFFCLATNLCYTDFCWVPLPNIQNQRSFSNIIRTNLCDYR